MFLTMNLRHMFIAIGGVSRSTFLRDEGCADSGIFAGVLRYQF